MKRTNRNSRQLFNAYELAIRTLTLQELVGRVLPWFEATKNAVATTTV